MTHASPVGIVALLTSIAVTLGLVSSLVGASDLDIETDNPPAAGEPYVPTAEDVVLLRMPAKERASLARARLALRSRPSAGWRPARPVPWKTRSVCESRAAVDAYPAGAESAFQASFAASSG